jgi:hypothetical protein
MALTYDGTGGLFTRLGKLIGMMNDVRTHQLDLLTELADVQGAYSSADSYMIETLAGNIERRVLEAGGILEDIKAAAEKTLIEMCYAEALTSTTNSMKDRSLESALVWLVRQMSADAEKVDGNTLSGGSMLYGASNNGNGAAVAFTECPNILLSNTPDWPNVREENVDIRCIQDAQDGSILKGQEGFEIRGQPGWPNLDRRFPKGSNISTLLTVCTAGIDAGPRYQNIGTNSDFEDQSSNLPLQWSLVSGTAGTDFATESTTVYRGTKAIRLESTGAVMKIRQKLGDIGGSLGKLTPDRPYVISFAIYKETGATGTVRVSVQDGSSNILAGGSFNASMAHTGFSAGAWVLVTAKCFSPRIIPSETYLVVETTTAISVADMYVDEVVVAEMVQHGNGGPYYAVLAGSSDWNADDNIRTRWTNNQEGDFNVAFDRLFDMYGKGLALPGDTAGTETILDTLIS